MIYFVLILLYPLEKARYVQETVSKSERCALTKLYNYRYLEERLDYEMDLVNKGDSTDLSILMLDIDHFKKVNDTYGHQSGNDILFMLARLFEECASKEAELSVRYGGEEFVYLLPGYIKRGGHFVRRKSSLENWEFQISELYPDLGKMTGRREM